MLFTDYGKAFDSIQRQILFDILESRNIPDTLLKATVDIETQNNILIQFQNWTKLIKVHQGCPLSCTTFNIHLDEITKWQKEKIKGIPLQKISTTINITC